MLAAAQRTGSPGPTVSAASGTAASAHLIDAIAWLFVEHRQHVRTSADKGTNGVEHRRVAVKHLDVGFHLSRRVR